jgi:alkylation response protein AidB-like acyl-CoA dehydrogenase
MAFRFTDDQRDLADGVNRLLADRATGDYARAVVRGEADWRDLWSEIAEMGIAALMVPEENGGLGLGPIELVAVAETIGRYLAPGPLVATAGWFVPAAAAAAGPLGPCLEAVAAEGAAATLGYSDPLRGSARIALDGDRLSVEGLLVPDLGRVDWLGFVVEEEGGPARVAVVPTAAVTALDTPPSLDPGRPLTRVRVEGAEAIVATVPADAPAPLTVPFVTAAAELVGMSARMLEISVEYAGEREQFGSKIGSFQAIKHRLADAGVMVEKARSLIYRAAVAAAEGDADALEAAHLAKAAASDVATGVARSAVQVHGGVGMTVEADVSQFYLRARQASMVLGDRDFHYLAAGG